MQWCNGVIRCSHLESKRLKKNTRKAFKSIEESNHQLKTKTGKKSSGRSKVRQELSTVQFSGRKSKDNFRPLNGSVDGCWVTFDRHPKPGKAKSLEDTTDEVYSVNFRPWRWAVESWRTPFDRSTGRSKVRPVSVDRPASQRTVISWFI